MVNILLISLVYLRNKRISYSFVYDFLYILFICAILDNSLQGEKLFMLRIYSASALRIMLRTALIFYLSFKVCECPSMLHLGTDILGHSL